MGCPFHAVCTFLFVGALALGLITIAFAMAAEWRSAGWRLCSQQPVEPAIVSASRPLSDPVGGTPQACAVALDTGAPSRACVSMSGLRWPRNRCLLAAGQSLCRVSRPAPSLSASGEERGLCSSICPDRFLRMPWPRLAG